MHRKNKLLLRDNALCGDCKMIYKISYKLFFISFILILVGCNAKIIDLSGTIGSGGSNDPENIVILSKAEDGSDINKFIRVQDPLFLRIENASSHIFLCVSNSINKNVCNTNSINIANSPCIRLINGSKSSGTKNEWIYNSNLKIWKNELDWETPPFNDPNWFGTQSFHIYDKESNDEKIKIISIYDQTYLRVAKRVKNFSTGEYSGLMFLENSGSSQAPEYIFSSQTDRMELGFYVIDAENLRICFESEDQTGLCETSGLENWLKIDNLSYSENHPYDWTISVIIDIPRPIVKFHAYILDDGMPIMFKPGRHKLYYYEHGPDTLMSAMIIVN